jgi:Holliday junction resolvase RusA-like endonuclease
MIVELPIVAMGKPRMTQRDKWKQRPCVLRYRAYKDELNAYLTAHPEILSAIESGEIVGLSWCAVLPLPKSWTKKKKEEMAGSIHRQKPDRDNIDKGILDALFKEDSGIACGYLEKIWDDGKGARLKLHFQRKEDL